MKKVATIDARKPPVTEKLPESAGGAVHSLFELDQEHVAWVNLVESLHNTEQLSRLARVLASGS